MGIHKFVSQVVIPASREVSQILSNNQPPIVDTLSFDANSLFHEAAAEIFGYSDETDEKQKKLIEIAAKTANGMKILKKEAITLTINKLISIITTINPTKYVIITVDGVVPAAKMSQQRSRRYKSVANMGIFNTNEISPGTPYMFALDEAIMKWAETFQNNIDADIIYSSFLDPGEGEHKIMKYMRMGLYPNGNHVIYGLDADLIVLSTIAPVENIYLWRNQKDFDKFVNIDYFKYYLTKTLGQNGIYDMTVLSFLIGNDFLPYLPALGDLKNSMPLLIKYAKEVGRLTNENGIDFEKLFDLFQKLDEGKMIHDVPPQFNRYSDEITKSLGSIFNFNKFKGLWYANELGNQENSNKDIEDAYMTTADRIDEMVSNYIEGLIWSYTYYTIGQDVVNWEWFYKYNQAPLITDIISKDIDVNGLLDRVLYTGKEYPNVIHQLLSILPPQSKDLLPNIKVIRDYVDSNAYMYPVEVQIVKVGDNLSGYPLLPPIDLDKIMEDLPIDMNDEDTKANIGKYAERDAIIFKKDEKVVKENKELRIKQQNLSKHGIKSTIEYVEKPKKQFTGKLKVANKSLRGKRGQALSQSIVRFE